MATQPPPLPPELYGVFPGPISAETVARIVNGLTNASAKNVRHIHLMFNSTGGMVGEGVTLYNLFRTLPFDLTLYNSGMVASIAVIAYLGARHRMVSSHATFMIHRTQVPIPVGAHASRVQTIVNAAVLDDERTEAILRKHITLTDERWAHFYHDDLYFSAEEAVASGLAEAIGEFSPPAGTPIYYV